MKNSDFIHKLVAQQYGVSLSYLRGPCRKRAIVIPRRIAMYLERTVLKHPLPTIAINFNRDHTTVLTGIAKLVFQMENNPELKMQVALYANRCVEEFSKPKVK